MKKEIKSTILLTVILFVGFGLMLWKAGLFEERWQFERGYYEGYKQGLDENYFDGWNDCRNNYQPNILL